MRGRVEYGGGNTVIAVENGKEEEGKGGNQEELAFETCREGRTVL